MIRCASTSSKDAIVVGDDGDGLTIDQVAIKSKRCLGDDEAESSHRCLDDEREAKRLRFDHNSEMNMDAD
ncbi:hypothetical protein FH972_024772 [Carpinus fangiana]|uniref:Uncharacterized protein n=1 Tax=Carpinus fangiana TaxID=176857 RepID=A0A5N6KYZ9_9ROSI|nr:hypothetical protein FH972_024772 [Carpinus fangiana]